MLLSSVSTRGIDNIVLLLDNKKQGIHLHTMRSSDSMEVDFSKPLAEKVVIQLLADADLRNDFIMHYPHFNSDGNRDILVQWIHAHLATRNNNLLEDIFDLASNINLYELSLLAKAEEVLRNRFFELTKLAAVDWMLVMRHKVDPAVFSRLNLIAYQHTTQRLVKLQAAINLSLQHNSYISKVSDILKNECYPTAFYRLVSNLEWLDDRQRGLFITLVEQLLYTKAFQEGVLSDLRVRLRSLIK